MLHWSNSPLTPPPPPRCRIPCGILYLQLFFFCFVFFTLFCFVLGFFFFVIVFLPHIFILFLLFFHWNSNPLILGIRCLKQENSIIIKNKTTKIRRFLCLQPTSKILRTILGWLSFCSRINDNDNMHPKPVGWTILYVMCAFFFSFFSFFFLSGTSDITKINLT